MQISVVIPVYNTKEYLAFCVNSVLSQTFSDYEILLVDDGSTDGSAELCDQLAKEHPQIRAIHKPNGGASSARNRGIDEAKGTYIHFIDSDDFLPDPGVYSELVSVFSSNVDILFSRRIRYNEDLTAQTAIQPEYLQEGLFEGDVLYDVISNDYELTLTCPVNKMFRTAFLREKKLYFVEGLLHEEDEWLPRVVANTQRVWFSHCILYGVRERSAGSFSAAKNDDALHRRTKAKLYTVTSGVEYMKGILSDQKTLQAAVGYYWGYFINAVVGVGRIKNPKIRRAALKEIKKKKAFFKNYKMLESRNWRLMGWMFAHLGVNFTSKIVILRYKQK